MKLGLKVNADDEARERLDGANPPFVEVWFNVNDATRYDGLFDELTSRRIEIGLHFWGLCDDNTAPNLAYPDTRIIRQTKALMQQTIDVAAARSCVYVNIHPGASALSRVNYQQERFDLVTQQIDTAQSIGLFLENASEIRRYAESQGVIFTVETVPVMITDGWYDAAARLTPKTIYELPDSAIIQAAQTGFFVANDFCHTAANVVSPSPQDVFDHLKTVTESLAPQTRLIHLGFVMPPYNGTDNHDMLDNPVFETAAAVPNAKQTVELLTLFRNRDDVYVLVEPKLDHVNNYRLARELVKTAENRGKNSEME